MAVFIEIRTEDVIFARYLGSLLADAGYSVAYSAEGPAEGVQCSLCIFSPKALVQAQVMSEERALSCPVLVAGYRDEFENAGNTPVRLLAKKGSVTLCRPFTDEALLGAVSALLSGKRKRAAADRLTINKSKRTASIGGSRVRLTEREFALLALLFEKRGETVSSEEINRVVFNRDSASAGNVTAVYISYLRKKLAVLTERPLVSSVRGKGYRLKADI